MRKLAAASALLLATSALAEIPEMTSAGIPCFRRDVSAIQILVNANVKAGATNADGRVMITPGSDPVKAINAATAEWSGLGSSLISFLPAQSTSLSNDGSDGKFVLTIEDTPENRSIAGSYLAITLYRYTGDGSITDTDIVFNPSVVQNGVLYPLSTDQSQLSYDLQSLVAHELGHSLGSSHSPVIGATMFQNQGGFSPYITTAEATVHRTLSADDIAFATTRYPAPAAQAALGSIAGRVAYSSGEPVKGAMVIAVAPATGATIGGIASLADGSYRLDSIPPGTYRVYAQPLNGPVVTGNLNGVPNISQADTSFRATFAGGNAAPSSIAVVAGKAANADVSVDPAASNMHVDAMGTGSAGGSDGNYFSLKGSPGGRAIDILLWGHGLDNTVTADQIRLLGPGIALRPASLHVQSNATLNGLPALRFTVDLTVSASNVPVTIAVVNGTEAAIYSGGFVVMGGAAACAYSVSPKQVSISASGGSATVTVSSGRGCPWTATGGGSWVHITADAATSGNGAVTVAADPNPNTPARSATVTIAGQSVVVSQSAGVAATLPVITRVVNGASFLPGIAAGSWVTILGTNLASTSPGRTWHADEIVAGRLPASLDGVGVTINGKPAYVYYVSPTQINVQAPSDTATGAVAIVVTNNGAASAPVNTELQQFAPGFFLYEGVPYAIVTRYPDNVLVGNPAAIPGTVAAAPGDILSLWATGFGPTNPATPAGQVVADARATSSSPTVTVGGLPVTVLGAALSPGSAGLYQIAIQLPASMPSGDAEIRASMGSVTSAAGVKISVR